MSVAAWALLEEYSDWRLAPCPRVNSTGPARWKAHGLVNDALRRQKTFQSRKANHFDFAHVGPHCSRSTVDLLGKSKTVEGMRIGGQQIGNRWVEDAYVYRVS